MSQDDIIKAAVVLFEKNLKDRGFKQTLREALKLRSRLSDMQRSGDKEAGTARDILQQRMETAMAGQERIIKEAPGILLGFVFTSAEQAYDRLMGNFVVASRMQGIVSLEQALHNIKIFIKRKENHEREQRSEGPHPVAG